MNKLTAEKCREQFEGWWQENQHNGNPPRFGWDHYRDGETYSDDEFQTLWEVWRGSRQALEIALPILEQQEQADRGWIEWGGGECPVEAQQSVEVKLRGAIENSNTASEFYWRHCQSRGDIIAYRIIPEQPTNQNGEQ